MSGIFLLSPNPAVERIRLGAAQIVRWQVFERQIGEGDFDSLALFMPHPRRGPPAVPSARCSRPADRTWARRRLSGRRDAEARSVLDMAFKGMEFQDMEVRLTTLEVALAEQDGAA